MASGKQVSFQFGEVSPELRFKSDAVSYSAGLSKLKNMYVRKAGGVSNRPGTTLIKAHAIQTYLTPEGGDPLIKAFVFWNQVTSEWNTIEYYKKDATGHEFIQYPSLEIHPSAISLDTIISPAPSKIKFAQIKDIIFVTPEITLNAPSFRYQGFFKLNKEGVDSGKYQFKYDFGLVEARSITNVVATINAAATGPFHNVSYLITANLPNGKEVYLGDYSSTGITSPTTPPTNSLAYPHSNLSIRINFKTVVGQKDFISINLYRATGKNGIKSFFKLASRIAYDGVLTDIELSDFGTDDVSITPALDTINTYIGALRGVNSAVFYQQRLIYSQTPGTGSNGIPLAVSSGEVTASKIGAPEQIVPPIIYSDTQAFRFSIPITDGTPVHAMLSLERLILFTERGTYLARGGEQGILTPSSVNPLLISEEGCSQIVEPKASGRVGYFINSGHTKLMGVAFGDDGNIKQIVNVSLYSSHFLHEDVIQMEVIGGEQDLIYILRRDGKLIQISVAPNEEQEVYGFSILETSGYIESIYRGKEKKPYRKTSSALDEVYQDVLMMYVIRNGTRYLERLDIREDVIRPSINFSDCTFAFGYALSFAGSDGYKRIALRDNSFPTVEFQKINIQPSASWDAGTVISIRSSNLIPSTYYSGGPYVIDFFYDENGIEKRLRYAINLSSQTATGDVNWPWQYTGTFDIEVPESLRNVNGISNISTSEKNKRWTRWIPATNGIPMFGQVIELWYAGGGSSSNLKVPICMVADGQLLSSPLNPDKPTFYIEKYFFTPEEIEENELPPGAYEYRLPFPDYYNYGYIGLPYESDFETLDLEASDNRTMTDSRKLLNSVGIALHETRGGFFGIENAELENMAPLSPTSYSPYNEHEETDNFNGHIAIPIPTNWSERGRVRVRQVDPLPMTILSVYPKGIAGD